MRHQPRPPDHEPVAAASSAGQPPLAHLQVGDSGDWIVALVEAWAALAEIFTFYQERIINEAFLATATQPSSITHLYNSLGHDFTANTTATTVVGYQLSASTAGPTPWVGPRRPAPERPLAERVRPAGGAPGGRHGTGPAADRPIWPASWPTSGPPSARAACSGRPPRRPPSAPGSQPVGAPPFRPRPRSRPSRVPTPCRPPTSPCAQLDAQVDLSGLAVRVGVPAAPTVTPATTQLVLAGIRTGLVPGQPVVVEAEDTATGQVLRWVRSLVTVEADARRGTTARGVARSARRAAPGDAPAAPATGRNVKLYRFAASAALFGSSAPMWTALTLARRLAVPAVDGTPLATRGGLLRSADAGAGWTPVAGWPAATGVTSLVASGDVVVAARRRRRAAPFGRRRPVRPRVHGRRPALRVLRRRDPGPAAGRHLPGRRLPVARRRPDVEPGHRRAAVGADDRDHRDPPAPAGGRARRGRPHPHRPGPTPRNAAGPDRRDRPGRLCLRRHQLGARRIGARRPRPSGRSPGRAAGRHRYRRLAPEDGRRQHLLGPLRDRPHRPGVRRGPGRHPVRRPPTGGVWRLPAAGQSWVPVNGAAGGGPPAHRCGADPGRRRLDPAGRDRRRSVPLIRPGRHLDPRRRRGRVHLAGRRPRRRQLGAAAQPGPELR